MAEMPTCVSGVVLRWRSKTPPILHFETPMRRWRREVRRDPNLSVSSSTRRKIQFRTKTGHLDLPSRGTFFAFFAGVYLLATEPT